VPDSSQPADADLRALVERVLAGSYEVDREIGRGGMGIVFRAKDTRLKRTVAIKLLPPELAFRLEIRSRFLKEAETAAQLSHPHIVPIYSVDEKQGLVFFVMQYVDGENLAVRLSTRGPSSPDETRRILREVADALAYAHSRGVIHRDIKPDNVLLTKEEQRSLVTDFGIARAITDAGDTRLTATGVAIGTPAYMSPEQCAGDREIDGRSDLYALGVLGFQMLAGRLPFEANTTPALLVKHLSERPIPVEELRADIPADLAHAINMCLEKDPANRFASAQALVQALDSRVMPPRTGQSARTSAGTAPAAASSTSTNRDGMLPPLPTWTEKGGDLPAIQDWGKASADTRKGYFKTYADRERASNTQGGARTTPAPYDPTLPSAEELQRWYAPPVEAFRRKLAPWVSALVVTFFVNLLGGPNLLFIPAFWGIGIAFGYAKIWSDGFDWRDVLREPRDRLLSDVVAGMWDTVAAFFDPEKRAVLRERRRRESQLVRPGPGTLTPLSPVAGAPALTSPLTAERAIAARQAVADRDEIARLVRDLAPEIRNGLGDVTGTASQLADRVQALAASLERSARDAAPGALDVLDREILLLESQANPLEVQASEERVRRLAFLRRQRRAAADAASKTQAARERLESCGVALQNLRFDILRLKTGTQTPQHITLVAEQALELARDVDGILAAQAVVARGSGASGRSDGRG
jgi:eukaryotic-like serine/threonine-protein kinase